MNGKTKTFLHFRPLFYGFLALLIAIVSTKFVFSGDLTYIIVVSVILFLTILFLCLKRQFFALIFLLSVFALGIGLYYLGLAFYSTTEYSSSCHISGRVTDYNSGNNYILDDVKVNGKSEKNIYITIVLSDNQIAMGDIISFDGQISQAKLFELGDLKTFYFRHNIGYTASVNEVDITKSGTKIKFAEKVRESIRRSLLGSMGSKNGSIAYSVLFGDKTQVEDDVKDAYNGAGIMHLLSVSGLHVGFLIALLGFVLSKCRVRGVANFSINFILIGFYAYLCSFSPSVVRAGVMGLVLLFASLSGRWYDNLNCMGLAGMIILLASPLSAFDAGFLMSFACVLSIFLIYPVLTKFLKKVFPNKIAEYFAISLSAEIGVLPFSAMIFSSFNFLAFFVNLIIIPIFSVLFPLLFISAILSALSGFFGFLLKFCGFGFDAIYFVADKFAQTKLTLILSPTSVYVILALFVLLFVLSKYFMVSKKSRTIAGLSVFGFLIILFGISLIPINVNSSVSFYSSFGSYSILVTNSAKESVIIDMGKPINMKKFENSLGIDNVGSVFVLNQTKVNYETFNDIGAKNIIRCGNVQGYEEEISVEQNGVSKVGGFDFCYHANSGKVFGLEIGFDGTRIFLFKTNQETDENVNFVSTQNFDFVVFANEAKNISAFSQQTKVIAQYSSEGVDSSYAKNGNFTYQIGSQGNLRRCLD